MRRFHFISAAICVIGFLAVSSVAVAGKEWPTWRGPARDGICTETGLLEKWTKQGPPLAWKIEGLGKGYSTIALADGRIFTMGQRKGKTYLIGLSLKTRKELWATTVGNGVPNCMPTVDGDRVYALSFDGELLCANVKTGAVVWRKSYKRDFGGKMMSRWGYSESLLIDGDRLICTPGSQQAMMAGLDKKTGAVIWKTKMPMNAGKNGRDGAGYSSVVISNGCGVKQYVQLVGRGVISVSAKTGKILWSYNRVANKTANVPTPIVSGDYIFCSTGYQTGSALLKLKKTVSGVKAVEQYFLSGKVMQNHHGGMVLKDGYIYCGNGHNKGFPLCIEMKTGKSTWKKVRGEGTGSAAVLYADGHLYFRYQNGMMALVEASSESYTLKGSFKLATLNGRSWPHPVIVDGKLYLRDQGTLLCYDITKK